MSCRVDSTLIAGACVVGDRGLGVLGSVIRSTTSTGAHGAGYLYNDWRSGDDAKEFRGLITTPPASGTLVADEDGSFVITFPADGIYGFTYRLFVDGADLGTEVASFTVGAGAGISAAVAGTGTVTYTGTGAVVGSIGTVVSVAVGGVGSIAYTGTASVSGYVSDQPVVNEYTFPGGVASVVMMVPKDSIAHLGRYEQQTNEVIDYDVDFSDWFVGRTDAIGSVVAFSDPGVSVLGYSIFGKLVRVVVSGGTVFNRYKITLRVTTNAALPIVREADWYVTIKEV